jgi:hypothetical protein
MDVNVAKKAIKKIYNESSEKILGFEDEKMKQHLSAEV